MNKCEKCGLEFTNKGGQISHQNACKLSEKDLIEIRDKYKNSKYSIKDVKKEYSLSTCVVERIIKDIVRTPAEARKIANEKYTLIHSEESKQKMREARLKYMKEHPENTAWRTSTISYPEKLFEEALIKHKLNESFSVIREYSIFPYFIDFAFINEKVAIEIDGSQHLLEERKIKDAEKDLLLKNNGWSVIRIAENQVKNNIEEVIQTILEVLNDNKQSYQTLGIITLPKKRIKVERDDTGYSEKEKERAFNQRKINRPTKEELLELIKITPFTTIAKQFGVSDNTIRKWCKAYDLPFKQKDIKLL